MMEIDKIGQAAITFGFQRTKVSKDGTTVWFSKPAAAPGQANHMICVDLVTRSGTLFWKKADASVDSRTFWNAEGLVSWLEKA